MAGKRKSHRRDPERRAARAAYFGVASHGHVRHYRAMEESTDTLTGRLLIATPGMPDSRFAHALVFLCAHSEDGAMGLIINKPLPDLTFGKLLENLEVPTQGAHSGLGDRPAQADDPVFFGGPVETSRGFVLHAPDLSVAEGSLQVSSLAELSTSLDMLALIARGHGPSHAMMALGYTGWGPGQLEEEMRTGGWLTCDASESLLFTAAPAQRWSDALRGIGVDPRLLSATHGTA